MQPELNFDGLSVPARLGESVAAALTRAGIQVLRQDAHGAPRGLFCGMGVCQDCVIAIDGEMRRACMTAVTGAHRLGLGGRNDPAAAASLPPIELVDIPVATTDILVIGGGAAGLSAATTAAEAGAKVVLIDERGRLGGQFFKQPHANADVDDDVQFAAGRALIARTANAGVRIVGKTEIWGAFAPRDIAASSPDGVTVYRPRILIVATGAYEISVPLPGWTLPGVMTTGAAQTLLRGEGVVAGRRVVVAGNGPLNLQVAAELARKGASVVALAELAPRPGLAHIGALWRMASSTPDLLRQGAALLGELRRRGVPLLHDHGLAAVIQQPDSLRAILRGTAPDSSDKAFDADIVCMGYGFQPANEILQALGCAARYDPGRRHLILERDRHCVTSREGIYAIGDCCGLGGAKAAQEEGIIAGAAAAAALGHQPASVAAAERRLGRHRRFQQGLWQLYATPIPRADLVTPDTMICRCESVTSATLLAALDDAEPSIGELKRRTRAGMGKCQGRYCAPTLAAMLAERQGRPIDDMAFFAPRAPIKPITIAALSRPGAAS